MTSWYFLLSQVLEILLLFLLLRHDPRDLQPVQLRRLAAHPQVRGGQKRGTVIQEKGNFRLKMSDWWEARNKRAMFFLKSQFLYLSTIFNILFDILCTIYSLTYIYSHITCTWRLLCSPSSQGWLEHRPGRLLGAGAAPLPLQGRMRGQLGWVGFQANFP